MHKLSKHFDIAFYNGAISKPACNNAIVTNLNVPVNLGAGINTYSSNSSLRDRLTEIRRIASPRYVTTADYRLSAIVPIIRFRG